MGKVGFAELAYWLVALRRPTPGELRCFESVLVALADHGLTPSALAARLTLTGAPESVQGALAAGLLGGGSRFLGVTEDAGKFLSDALGGPAESGGAAARPLRRRGMRSPAMLCARSAQLGGYVPGLGHTLHKQGDPGRRCCSRSPQEEGLFGPHLAAL